MDLKQLSDFVAICRAGSFAAASRRLNTSQPGLGYQIKQLEFELDVDLLTRHSRGVTLTSAGTTFLGHAERILDAVKDARGSMVAYKSKRRTTLRVGLSPTPVRLVERAIAMLSGSLKDVEFTLREGFSGELVDQTMRGDLDIAITLDDDPHPGFRLRPLYREKLCLIAKNTGGPADADPISLAMVASLPIVAGPRGHIVRERLAATACAAGVEMNIVQELDPSGLRRSLVVYGDQRTVAALGVFVDEYERGLLEVRRIEPPISLAVNMLCAATVPVEAEEAIAAAVATVIVAFDGYVDPPLA